MVYDDKSDPELNGHWFEEDAKLIFWTFGISTLIGVGIILYVVS